MNPYGVPGGSPQDPNTSGPVNQAYGDPGWGMDPNYRTPGYDAPYRPAYMGANPYAAYNKPSLVGAAYQLSPFAQSQYWGNPVNASQAAIESLSGKPMDSAAWVAQRIAFPILGYSAAQRMFTGPGRAIGGGLMTGIGEGIFGNSVFQSTKFGRWMGGTALPAVGGFAGHMLGGMALTQALDASIIQPYIRTGQMTNDIASSFAGMNMGYGGGVVSGRGLSRAVSANIAGRMDSFGSRDMTFSSNQIAQISSLSMKAGLFDDVSTENITRRMRGISEQVKALVAISNDPSVQSAVESLAKLRMSGAGIDNGTAVSAYRSMGGYASIAGTSVQKLMSTVGMQAQYSYQANGLTPYLGQLAAGNAYAGFASAQRSGILSSAMLARMGGIEGATQSLIGAHITGALTPYAQIGMYNQYMAGGAQRGMINNVSAFGASASGDPLATYGAMTLYGPAMTSRALKGGGSRMLEKQIYDTLVASGEAPAGRGGKYTPEQAAAIMPGMGFSQDQIQAFVQDRVSHTSAQTLALTKSGAYSQEQEQLRQVSEQYGATYGGVGETFNSIRRGWKGAVDTIEETGRSLNQTKADLADGLSSFYDRVKFGKAIPRQGSSIDTSAMLKGMGKDAKGKYLSNSNFQGLMSRLSEDAAKEGPQGDLARKIINSKLGGSDAKRLLRQYAEAIGHPDWVSGSKIKQALFGENVSVEDVRGALNTAGAVTTGSEAVNAAVDEYTGKDSNAFDQLKILDQASQFASSVRGYGDDEIDAEYGDLTKDKFPELNAYLSKGGGSAAKKLKAALLHGLSSGVLAGSVVAGHMGSIDDAMNDPSSVSNDPEVIKKIMAAKAKGDRGAVGKILAQEALSTTGVSKFNLPSDTEMGGVISAVETTRKRGEQISEAAQDNKSPFNWSSVSDVMKALDDSSKSQLEAARIQLEAAKLNSGKTDGPTWLPTWLGGSDNQKATTPK